MCEAGFGRQTCKDDEEYSSCGTPRSCFNLHEEKKECIPGCFCKDNKLWNKRSECVPERECEQYTDSRNLSFPFKWHHSNKEKCPLEEEYYSECEANMFCQDWCEDMKQECPRHLCSSGCRCKEGFVRNNKDGKCIRKHQCPKGEWHPNPMYWPHEGKPLMKVRNPIPYSKSVGIPMIGHPPAAGYPASGSSGAHLLVDPKKSPETGARKRRNAVCPKNEFLSSCGGNGRCQAWCNRKKPHRCPLVCQEGCMCKEGYIRKVAGGTCIPEKDCPTG